MQCGEDPIGTFFKGTSTSKERRGERYTQRKGEDNSELCPL